MDKETIALIEDVRKSLVDYGKTQTGSALKKTRKITSQIIWDPSSYLDELDNIKATSKTPQEAINRIRSLVRSSEEAALKSMTLLPDDTGHHIVQSRTGGDALTELPYERTGPIIERLSEKHQQKFGNTVGPGGNLPAEMSLSNFAHKADDRATGLERESGIGKNPDKTTTAHQKGTAGYASMKGVDLTSDVAIEADLSKKIGEQQQMAATAAKTDAPRQQAIRQAIPGAYQGGVEDIAKAKLEVPKLLTEKSKILDSYRNLRLNKLRTIAGTSAAVGIASLGPLGTAASAAETKARTDIAKETGNPIDAIQAGISGASLTADVASYNPIAAPIAAPVSTVFDVANTTIDSVRQNGFFNTLRNGIQSMQQARNPLRGF